MSPICRTGLKASIGLPNRESRAPKNCAGNAKMLDHYSGDLDEAAEAMTDRYMGEHASLADYVQDQTEESIAIPQTLRYYIDYQAARDAEISGDLFTVSTRFDVVHVFAGC